MAKLWASFSLKGVINRTREAGASALTPFRGRLLGPVNRGQCLPFTPRYSRSVPWPFPAGKHSPHGTASQSVPLFRPAQPLTTLPLCLIPFFFCTNTLSLQLSSTLLLSGIVVTGPIIVLHWISQQCLHSGDFFLALNHSSGNWCDLEVNACECLSNLKRKNALWKSCLSCY